MQASEPEQTESVPCENSLHTHQYRSAAAGSLDDSDRRVSKGQERAGNGHRRAAVEPWRKHSVCRVDTLVDAFRAVDMSDGVLLIPALLIRRPRPETLRRGANTLDNRG